MKNRNKTTKFPVVRKLLYYLSKNSRIKFATCQLICIQTNIQARIKKIMQKDEEVGKVAQATPIVICTSHFPCLIISFFVPRVPTNKQNVLAAKALELFLQLVVDEASRVTASRGSKKVEAYHLCVLISHSHFTPILTLTLPPKETRD